MRLTAILPVVLCAFVIASPIQKRDAAAVLSDISAIASEVSALDGLVTSYTGSYSQNSPVISAVESLQDTIQKATNDTTSSTAFDEADSEAISQAISNLTLGVIQAVQDIQAKVCTSYDGLEEKLLIMSMQHDVVASAGEIDAVEDALKDLLGYADGFLTAVTDQVTESEEGAIDTSADEINYAFNQVITTYSS